jgi:hypothetical protein
LNINQRVVQAVAVLGMFAAAPLALAAPAHAGTDYPPGPGATALSIDAGAIDLPPGPNATDLPPGPGATGLSINAGAIGLPPGPNATDWPPGPSVAFASGSTIIAI